jgi:hypothetical protein
LVFSSTKGRPENHSAIKIGLPDASEVSVAFRISLGIPFWSAEKYWAE